MAYSLKSVHFVCVTCNLGILFCKVSSTCVVLVKAIFTALTVEFALCSFVYIVPTVFVYIRGTLVYYSTITVHARSGYSMFLR